MDALSQLVLQLHIVKEYKEGASIRHISGRHEVPYTTVRAVLVRHHVKLRGVGKNVGRNNGFRYRDLG